MASRVQKIMFWDTFKNAKSVILHYFPVAEIGSNIHLLYFSYPQEIWAQFVEWGKKVLSPYSPQWSVYFSVSLLQIAGKHPVFIFFSNKIAQLTPPPSHLYYFTFFYCVVFIGDSVVNNSCNNVRFILRSIMSFSTLYKWSDSFRFLSNPFFLASILQMNIICLLQLASFSFSVSEPAFLFSMAQCSPPTQYSPC